MYEPLLQNIRSIVALTEEEGALLCTHVERRRVKKRQWLVTPGEPCRAEHYILKGCFRAYCVGDDGQEHITKLSVEDWWITDVQRFLTGEPAQLYVEALEDGEVVVFRKDKLDALYEALPQLNKYFRLLYQMALANNLRRIHKTIAHTAEEHYLQFLEQFPSLEQRVPQYMIASYLGITPEFLSRIRRRRAQNH